MGGEVQPDGQRTAATARRAPHLARSSHEVVGSRLRLRRPTSVCIPATSEPKLGRNRMQPARLLMPLVVSASPQWMLPRPRPLKLQHRPRVHRARFAL